MKVFWMFLILAGCRLCHSTQSQSSCSCRAKLKKVCVAAGQTVLVPCPNLTGEVFKFSLLKDQTMIFNHTCSHDKNSSKCIPPYSRGVELHQNPENQLTSFILTRVNASSHGVYRCEGTVEFPPPLLPPVPGAVEILVLIEGHQCDVKECLGDPKAGGDENSEIPWIWIAVLVTAVYSVIISILASVFWVRLKKTDSQSDYMNTKPRAARDRRKNRGVQNPAPRYF